MNIVKKLLLVGMIGFLVGCDDQLLLSHLSQRQSNEVLAVLQEHGVDASRKQDNKQGDSIRIGLMTLLSPLICYDNIICHPKIPLRLSKLFLEIL